MLHLDHLPNAISDEHLAYFLRRHPITLLSLFLCYVVVIAAPFLIWIGLHYFYPAFFLNQVGPLLLMLGGSAVFLYIWLFLFQAFLDYYLDSWIVTSRRIINIEQTGLFGRTVSELRLYRVQDVTATVNGMINTLFDFGDVEIQTAGEKERFLFEQVPHPNAVAKAIQELAEEDRREHLDDAVEEFEGTGNNAQSAPHA